ncbi:MAG: pilus assembly protein [Selenomonadaceae bacterium]|nr:pilus assembly protein [Selenomonadaceae bacterium]
MKKFFGQRGQAAVEFTLVLPFFVLVLLSTIYLGMFVVDYVTLDNAANAAARHAAVNNKNTEDPTKNYTITDDDKEKIKETKLFLTWYTLKKKEFDCSKSKRGKFVEGEFQAAPDGDYVQVLIQATSDLAEGNIFKNILPKNYTVAKVAKIEN